MRLPDPELMPIGTLRELGRGPPRISMCLKDYLSTPNPALNVGFYLTF